MRAQLYIDCFKTLQMFLYNYKTISLEKSMCFGYISQIEFSYFFCFVNLTFFNLLIFTLIHECSYIKRQIIKRWGHYFSEFACCQNWQLQYIYVAKIVSEYDQEIPQSQTADNPVAP